MDRNHETRQAEAAARAANTEAGKVEKVYLDSEVARAMGHENVEWDGERPYVKPKPLPDK